MERPPSHTMYTRGSLVRKYGPASGVEKTLVELIYKGPVSVAVDGDITLLKTGPHTLDLDQALVSGFYGATIVLKRIER